MGDIPLEEILGPQLLLSSSDSQSSNTYGPLAPCSPAKVLCAAPNPQQQGQPQMETSEVVS